MSDLTKAIRKDRHPCALFVVLLLFTALTVGTLIPEAAWGQVVRSYPNTIVYSFWDEVIPPSTQHCVLAYFAEFDDIPGATHYASYVYDNGVLEVDTGPPFDDVYKYGGWHYAPAGSHRKMLSGYSTTYSCPITANTSRFVPDRVDVTFPSEPPTAAFSFAPVPDDPMSVSFDGAASTGGIVSYEWNFGDGKFGSGVTTSHTFAKDGIFSVKLTVTDGDGLGDVARKDVEIDTKALSYTPVPDPGTVLMGDTFVLTLKVKNIGSADLAAVGPVALPTDESSDGGTVTLVGGPDPAVPVALAPGATQDFSYEYDATAVGTVDFTALVEGTLGSGSTVTAKLSCPAGGCRAVTITDQEIVVNSVDIAALLPAAIECDTGNVIQRGGVDEPECTLNAAVTFSNDRAGIDYITFDIPDVAGMPEIARWDYLLKDQAVIDGTTQPGAGRVGLLGYEGTFVGPSLQTACEGAYVDSMLNFGPGLVLESGSGGSEIRGLAVYGFDTAGILVTGGSGGNVIADNIIGSDGVSSRGNGSSCSTFGGDVLAPFKYLGGGVVVQSSGNTVQGNHFEGNGSLIPPSSPPLAYQGFGLRLEGVGGNSVIGNTFFGATVRQAVVTRA